jgi:hypothetical protein
MKFHGHLKKMLRAARGKPCVLLRAARGNFEHVCSTQRAGNLKHNKNAPRCARAIGFRLLCAARGKPKKKAPRCARKPNYCCSALRAVFFCPALRANNLKRLLRVVAETMQHNTPRCAQKT